MSGLKSKILKNEFEGGITEALEDSKSGLQSKNYIKRKKPNILAFAGNRSQKE